MTGTIDQEEDTNHCIMDGESLRSSGGIFVFATSWLANFTSLNLFQ